MKYVDGILIGKIMMLKEVTNVNTLQTEVNIKSLQDDFTLNKSDNHTLE